MPNANIICQFLIVLMGIDPLIWRRIHVPHDYSFWDLHVAIQDAMGWEDYHLHEFSVIDPDTKRIVDIGLPEIDGPGTEELLPGRHTPIAAYFPRPLRNAAGTYLYDFGDGWKHLIALEDMFQAEQPDEYPRCVSGMRNCPPEDSGGPWRYPRLLEALENPNDEEHERMMEWLGGGFDPEEFEPGDVHFDDPDERWERAFS